MSGWDPVRYLQFERERTQPCRDLVARIEGSYFGRIVDLGCGPGTSTAVLRARWPDGVLVGIDSSEEMLVRARATDPSVTWQRDDIARWVPDRPFDLVFSNAALQWLPDHATLFPRLFGHVAPGGALAVQMPANSAAPYQRAARRIQTRPPWSGFRAEALPGTDVAAPAVYYHYLADLAQRIELWDTGYVHVLSGPDAIVDWTLGTGLRPWIAGLPDEAQRGRFLAEYRAEIAREYPSEPDGKVLFPFLRRFLIAYR